MKSRGYRILVLPILLALGACQPAPPTAERVTASASAFMSPASPTSPVPSDGVIDNSELMRLAAQALQAHRLYAPAGDNAVEFYLAARARRADDAAIRSALTELQPYLLIATEQALERGDGAEAARLFELLRRLDPQAPALPRLQAGLAGLPQAPSAQAPQAIAGVSAPDSRAPLPATQSTVSATASVAAPTPGAMPPETPAATAPASVRETARSNDAVVVPASTATASPPPSAPVRAVATVSTPRLLQDAQPRYPLPALRNRVEGEVELAFVIRPDGSVGDVRLTSAQPRGVFDAAAMAVAARWRFEATGRPRAWQRTVRFRLPPQ